MRRKQRSLSSPPERPRAARRGTVLVVGAHPDDYELAAGIAIQRLKQEGRRVVGVVCSSGERGGSARIRQRESENAAAILGIDDLHFLGYADTRFPKLSRMIRDFEAVAEREGPELVLTHAPCDTHQDHVAVSTASGAAFRTVDQVLLFRGFSARKEFQPHVMFKGDPAQLERKLEAIRAHRSQVPKLDLDQVRATAVFYGGFARSGDGERSVAEPFTTNHYYV
jgi:LmbE family N-acetylglucosaminyl deacetylase